MKVKTGGTRKKNGGIPEINVCLKLMCLAIFERWACEKRIQRENLRLLVSSCAAAQIRHRALVGEQGSLLEA